MAKKSNQLSPPPIDSHHDLFNVERWFG